MSHDEPTCEEVIEQLFDFLDNELSPDRSAEIDRHLERCRDCCTRAQFERRLREKVSDAGRVKAPDRLHDRIKGLLDRF